MMKLILMRRLSSCTLRLTGAEPANPDEGNNWALSKLLFGWKSQKYGWPGWTGFNVASREMKRLAVRNLSSIHTAFQITDFILWSPCQFPCFVVLNTDDVEWDLARAEEGSELSRNIRKTIKVNLFLSEWTALYNSDLYAWEIHKTELWTKYLH